MQLPLLTFPATTNFEPNDGGGKGARTEACIQFV